MIALDRYAGKGVSCVVRLDMDTPSLALPLLRVLARVSLAIALREASAEESGHRPTSLTNGDRATNARGRK